MRNHRIIRRQQMPRQPATHQPDTYDPNAMLHSVLSENGFKNASRYSNRMRSCAFAGCAGVNCACDGEPTDTPKDG